MNLKEAQKFLEKEISVLEQGVYTFENIARPRYEADKTILRGMKDQHVKLMTLIEKVNAGAEVTQQEVHEAVPAPFR